MMGLSGSQALEIRAACSAVAALAHLACIALGPAAFRFMGAGEKMARALFPENSNTFWWVSSGVCLAIGLLHAYGLAQCWAGGCGIN